jgi:hypothetical protein
MRIKHCKAVFFLLIGLGFLFVSCKKEMKEVELPAPESAEVQLKKEILLEAVEALKKVYSHPDAVMEVRAAVQTRYYWDDQVWLRDLLNPDQSLVYKKAQMKSIPKGRFKEYFMNAINDPNFTNLKKYVDKEIIGSQFPPVNTQADNVVPPDPCNVQQMAIYFPYNEVFASANNPNPTLVAATVDANSAPGQEPGNNGNYASVTVNDAYAKLHPTHIIEYVNPCDVPPIDPIPNPPVLPSPESVIDTTYIPVGRIDTVRQIYVGKAILKRHYDPLISFTGNGGGSEIYFCRASGYLQNDNDDQVNQSQNFDRVYVYFRRSDIEGVFTLFQTGYLGMLFNDPRWKTVNTIWDDNWEPKDFEQVFAIYEEDNRGSITTGGTLSTTLDSLGIPVQGTLNFSFTRKSQDNWLRQLKFSYLSYLGYTLSAPLCRTQDSYPVWDCGADISYTLPMRVQIFR